jgi:FkbM family methyltransferase
VVVPVYRGLDETANCLYTLLSSRVDADIRCEVTVIDDKSPEPELSAYLDRLAGLNLFTLVRNEENQGFVGSVNTGMSRLPSHDVILLNSDTEVYGDWVERLHAAAHAAPDIGTATPFSNNATICSYPLFCTDFDLPFEVGHREIDALAREANAGAVVDIPTGVGFCLYIRRDCLDAVGLFRQDVFGQGYGEENDFCQRALALGWRNVLAGDTFVRHFGRVSFLDSSEERSRNAQELIDQLHPAYLPTVRAFCESDPLRPLRERLDLARLKAKIGDRVMLFVSSALGGGTEQHQRDMEKLLEKEGVGVVFLRPVSGTTRLELGHPDILDVPNIPSCDITQGPAPFARVLRDLGIMHIHVHHLLGFSPEMPDYIAALAQSLGLGYDVTLHDYAAVCPRINMIDDSGVFCDNHDIERCQSCVDRNGSPFGPVAMWRWRIVQEEFLRRARHVFVPHLDVKTRLKGIFPGANIQVRTHPELLPPMDAAPVPREPDEPLRVALIGAIGPHKGFAVFKACAEAAQRLGQPITFIVIGYLSDPREVSDLPNVVVTGPYDQEDLPGLLEKYRCHLAFFPAVWPETYSYTLSQAFAAGLYPVCFDLGAPAGRIREVVWGELLPLELCRHPRVINERLLGCVPPPKPPGLSATLGGRYDRLLTDYYGLGDKPEEEVSPQPAKRAERAAPPRIPEALAEHVVAIDGRYGTLRYYDFDAVIGRSLEAYGEWGQRELDLLTDLVDADAVVVDGGAHVGVYSQAFARSVGPRGRIISFEPNPVLYPLLVRNTASCPCSVEVHHAALDAEPRVVHITPLGTAERANLGALALKQMVGTASAQSAPVPVVNLDSLELRRLDFLKLDLEGMEPLALAGGKRTISTLQPLIYVECNTPGDGWRSLSAVREFGYRGILCRFPAYNPENWRGNATNFFGPAHESGLLLAPPRFAEKIEARLCGPDMEPIETLEDLHLALQRTPRFGDVTAMDRSFGQVTKDLETWARDAHRLLKDLTDQGLWSDRDRHLAVFLREAWNALQHPQDTKKEATAVAEALQDVLERSGFFNEHFYRAAYPGAAAANTPALYHFLTEGWRQGYAPAPGFDTVSYMQRYPDVSASGHNPLLHYIFFGQNENRDPLPS